MPGAERVSTTRPVAASTNTRTVCAGGIPGRARALESLTTPPRMGTSTIQQRQVLAGAGAANWAQTSTAGPGASALTCPAAALACACAGVSSASPCPAGDETVVPDRASAAMSTPGYTTAAGAARAPAGPLPANDDVVDPAAPKW